MKLSICAFKQYETAAGFIAEEAVPPVDAANSAAAEKIARKLFETGEYSSIYIQHHEGGYYNPSVGYEPVGKNWVTHFENEES